MNETFDMIKIQFPMDSGEVQNLPFYVLHIGSMEFQHPCLRQKGLEHFQILFCTQGEGLLRTEGKEYRLHAGMGMFLRPQIPHDYFAISEPWTTHWILFDGCGIDTLSSIQRMGNAFVFYIHNLEKLIYLHGKVYNAAERNSLLTQNDLSIQLYRFLLEMDSCFAASPQKNSGSDRLHAVIHHIEQHYSEDMPLEELASLAGITPQHLCRLFQNSFHMRPVEYITKYRMKQAKHLLLTQKELTLMEISERIGFHDVSYFCNLFKKAEGMTPASFRKMG